MAADVRAGLSCPFKELPPKYFYDERGSQLFEQITELPEYYPTRAERAILEPRAAEIVAAAGPGDADRARLGLGREDARACSTRCATPAASRPTSRSTSPRRSPGETAERARRRVRRACACTASSATSRPTSSGSRATEGGLIAFLGGTIGNFRPAPRRSFLRPDRDPDVPEDRFLLGTDLVKDRGDARGRLRRLRRGHRRVQQERARRAQPRARRRLRPRRLRARRLLGRRERAGSTSACARSPSSSVDLAALDMRRPLRAATRRCAPRSRPSSPASGLEAIYADAGLELTDWWTDPDGLYALSRSRGRASG